jgi:hypothetical protein
MSLQASSAEDCIFFNSALEMDMFIVVMIITVRLKESLSKQRHWYLAQESAQHEYLPE